MEMKPGMALNPGFDPWMFMRAVIIYDEMKSLLGRGFRIDLLEKAKEFLMTMARHTIPNYAAIQHIKGGEEGGGPVALVVMGLPGG